MHQVADEDRDGQVARVDVLNDLAQAAGVGMFSARAIADLRVAQQGELEWAEGALGLGAGRGGGDCQTGEQQPGEQQAVQGRS